METIHVSELRTTLIDLREEIKESINAIIKAIDTKILVGEINRPEVPVEKKVRKKRTPKVVEPGLVVANILDASLPEDKSTFYGKKRGRRGRKTSAPSEIQSQDRDHP